MTSDLNTKFLTKVRHAHIKNQLWLKVEICQTKHLRLVVKLKMESLLQPLPLSVLIKHHKAQLAIKARRPESSARVPFLKKAQNNIDPPLLIASELGI